MIPLFFKGYQKDLTIPDIYRTIPDDETKVLGDRLEAAWLEEVAQAEDINNNQDSLSKAGDDVKKPSIINALYKIFGPTMAAYGGFALFEECFLK